MNVSLWNYAVQLKATRGKNKANTLTKAYLWEQPKEYKHKYPELLMEKIRWNSAENDFFRLINSSFSLSVPYLSSLEEITKSAWWHCKVEHLAP
jgi:hypothetical protein